MIVEYWENGRLKQRQATHAEEISHTEWHKPKQYRVIMHEDCLRTLNLKKEFNEPIAQLYAHFKSTTLDNVEIDGGLIVYVDSFKDDHDKLLQQNGAIIESRT